MLRRTIGVQEPRGEDANVGVSVQMGDDASKRARGELEVDVARSDKFTAGEGQAAIAGAGVAVVGHFDNAGGEGEARRESQRHVGGDVDNNEFKIDILVIQAEEHPVEEVRLAKMNSDEGKTRAGGTA